MLGIPFIQEVFKAVLQESKVIQGRFFTCPDYASEINGNNLDEIVTAATGSDNLSNWPGVVMLPPMITGDFGNPDPSRLTYPITLLFLTTSYYDSNNNPKQPDPTSGESTHTIPMDWHDMQRCAMEFCKTLQQAVVDQGISNVIYPSQRDPQQIQMISKMGNARLSGVMLTLSMVVFTSCEGQEDYAPGAAARINFTAQDSHPGHTH